MLQLVISISSLVGCTFTCSLTCLLMRCVLPVLQVLRATHAHDLERLAEAEARLKDELAAKAARDAKAEEEAEEAAAEKALQARQLAAAITIQAAWRGYQVGVYKWSTASHKRLVEYLHAKRQFK
jgi:hypothetical protein